MNWSDQLCWITEAGHRLSPGLTEAELVAVESMHGFRFPPDLRSLLATALPTGERFPDWRDPNSAFVLDRLSWPADSICFDVEHNGFWWREWGDRPGDLEEALRIARVRIAEAPHLIPIFAHRYIPAEPCEHGNPVFSVYQTDIIIYGQDLASYLSNEFRFRGTDVVPENTKPIRFWTDVVLAFY